MEEQTGGSKGKFLDVSFGRRCGRKLWKTINGKDFIVLSKFEGIICSD